MKTKILLITHDKGLSKELARELGNTFYEISNHENGEVMQVVFDQVPHLIVIDEEYDGAKGKRIGLSLKQDFVLKYIPIILVVKNKKTLLLKDFQRIDHFFEKKNNLKSLLTLIRQALKKNQNELDVNPLTHLPGVRSSVLWIERSFSSKRNFAMLCIDLSYLAVFNKAYGDSRGDEVIIRTSEILKKALRLCGGSDYFLGHFGGDDFIIVTEPDRSVPISESIIQNFDAEIASFYDAEDRDRGYLVQRDTEGRLKQYPIMSISVAIMDNQNTPLKEMTQLSLIASELEKTMRVMPGSCYVVYRPPKKKSAQEPSENSHQIHFPGKMKSIAIPGPENPQEYVAFFYSILKDQKIDTLYQPIVDLKLKKAVGYEALSRPVLYYPPDEATTLFGMARQVNQVKELDLLCVEFALQRAQELPQELKLFLNLNHETLVDPIAMRGLLDDKGVIGFKNIVIEITEQSILRSFDKVRDALSELKEQGVAVAIDDVGGGAVSLRDVAVLKPDYIKFDRSLIRQIDVSTTKQQILLSLILFARGIGASTVAEGVETREEYETTIMCGIHLAQGYYFARPGHPFPQVLPEEPE